MSNEDILNRAKELVVNYNNTHNAKQITNTNVFIVWFSKTLQNWKALVGTCVNDGMYYEITYNGDKNETYIDAYRKVENVCVK